MAQGQAQDPKDFVYTFTINAGIKRDGVAFESSEFTDGEWCRFQRGVPRKMGGYRVSFQTNNGIPRGLISQSISGANYISIGNSSGIDVFVGGTENTTGIGPFSAQFLSTYGQTSITSVTNQTTFLVSGDQTKLFSPGQKIVFSSAASTSTFTVATSTSSGTSPNFITTIVTTAAYTGTPTVVYAYGTQIAVDVDRQWQFDVMYNGGNINQLQLIAHGALNLQNIDNTAAQPIYTGNILPQGDNQWTLSPLADTEGPNPTGQIIQVDGGICSGYPFLFAYGSSGLIINNHVDQGMGATKSLNNWNGPFANSVNIAAGKVLKGFPIRGGTASPSMLFFATDSVIRASFNPGGGAGLYWQYDLLASKISVLSSNAIAQCDGAFLWPGVDRFYTFNGQVKVLTNNKNLNWFYDNLNYAQRQKVWSNFVAKYNEWWVFFPTGNNTECNRAIIYNVQDQIWYDAGENAPGARRSCGYLSEVLPYQTWAGWEPINNFTLSTQVLAQPSGLPAPTSASFYVAGNQTIAFSPGNFVSLRNTSPEVTISIVGAVYYNSATYDVTLITAATPISTLVLPVGTTVWAANASGYPTWTHEIGTDRVIGSQVSSIRSMVETNDISWVGGNVSQDAPQGMDRSVRLIRIEPNFKQFGDMTVQAIGRAYASSDNEIFGDIQSFSPATDRVYFTGADYRQLRLRFDSDTIGGYFEMGRLLIKVDYGSEMPNL